MPSFFEGFLSVFEDDWLGGTSFNFPQVLHADSETLTLNKNIQEKAVQVSDSRVSKSDSLIYRETKPEGEITYQFRSADIVKTLYSHFQLATFEGSNPYRYGFYPKPRPLNWELRGTFTQGAYSVNTDGQPYTVSVLKKMYDTTQNGGTNAFFFKHGVCNRLRFDVRNSEDAKAIAAFKFTEVDAGTPVSANPPQAAVGTYATTRSFYSWVATVSVGGQALDVSGFSIDSDQNFQEFTRVGKLQPENYQLSSYRLSGQFELDLPQDSFSYVASMFSGQTFSFMATLRNGTNDQVVFDLPHCKRMPFDYRQTPNQSLRAAIPFNAYESNGTYPIKVTVFTDYNFGAANVLYLDAWLGTRHVPDFELYDATLGTRDLGLYEFYTSE